MLAEDADLRLPGASLALDDLLDVQRWRPAEVPLWRVDDPLVWFAAERPSLVAVVRQAARLDMAELACGLAAVTSRFFKVVGL